ncbi:hypothetical protein CAPTEDRAFT_209353 [Capitella teleta]|uniref:Uncharacterized protein n=1 Tax=Capitella teleta TaxID=283909 RepID=R7TLH5_CAPTE|nr:hypothetical protein CAPTEDRAFT_209353 [Capitella teleta]|eukprot:ELT94693.1 hypothetical protein CAPTEDRAFT_209353 [Capitella teleta]
MLRFVLQVWKTRTQGCVILIIAQPPSSPYTGNMHDVASVQVKAFRRLHFAEKRITPTTGDAPTLAKGAPTKRSWYKPDGVIAHPKTKLHTHMQLEGRDGEELDQHPSCCIYRTDKMENVKKN